MIDKIKKGLKGVKRFMNEKTQYVKDALTTRTNRAIAGMILGGISIGLLASAYFPLPS